MTTSDTAVSLPRPQAGGHPQHLAVTLLADFWKGRPVFLPTSALVEMLGELGVTESSARSALSRLAGRGVLVTKRAGRSILYRLAPDVDRLGSQAVPRIFAAAAARGAQDWDGMWTVVTFSLPSSRRVERTALRSQLRALGFAPLQDGVWISPGAFSPALADALRTAPEGTVSVFRATLEYPESLAARRAEPAHALEELGARYRDFVAEFSALPVRQAAGELSPADAFVARVTLADTWRALYHADPRLPAELLPDDWARPAAGAVLIAGYDALGALAEQHCRAILAPLGLADDEQPRHYVSSDVLAPAAGGATSRAASSSSRQFAKE